MRKSRFSESQIVETLKEADSGLAVADLRRKHGVSKATFFKWRSKYGGATVADVKRLKELEAENTKLKKMYADLALETAARSICPKRSSMPPTPRRKRGRCSGSNAPRQRHQKPGSCYGSAFAVERQLIAGVKGQRSLSGRSQIRGCAPRGAVRTSDSRRPGKTRPVTFSRKMAGPTRLELATSGVTGQRSNQLNYDPATYTRKTR